MADVQLPRHLDRALQHSAIAEPPKEEATTFSLNSADGSQPSSRLTAEQKHAQLWRANAPRYQRAQARARKLIQQAGGNPNDDAHMVAYIDALTPSKAQSPLDASAPAILAVLKKQFAATSPSEQTFTATSRSQATRPSYDYQPLRFPRLPLGVSDPYGVGINTPEAYYKRTISDYSTQIAAAQRKLQDGASDCFPLSSEASANLPRLKELAETVLKSSARLKSAQLSPEQHQQEEFQVISALHELTLKWNVLPTHPHVQLAMAVGVLPDYKIATVIEALSAKQVPQADASSTTPNTTNVAPSPSGIKNLPSALQHLAAFMANSEATSQRRKFMTMADLNSHSSEQIPATFGVDFDAILKNAKEENKNKRNAANRLRSARAD